jgi:hypothetical protein
MLGEDFVDQRPIDAFVFHRHLAGHHDADDRLAAASAGAAGFVQDDIGPGRGGDVFAKLFVNVHASGGVFAGCRANLDPNPIAHPPLPQRFFRFGGHCLEIFDDCITHDYSSNSALKEFETVEISIRSTAPKYH